MNNEIKMLELALEIAINAHKGQYDDCGMPYIFHPLHVACNVKTIKEKTVALLHDVIEDTEITLNDIKNYGFSNDIIEALDAITRSEDEDYSKYIETVSKNKIATKVKLADLDHNSDISRIKGPDKEDFKRLEKYKKAKEYLITKILIK